MPLFQKHNMTTLTLQKICLLNIITVIVGKTVKTDMQIENKKKMKSH